MSAQWASRHADELTGVVQPVSVASLAGLVVVSAATVLMLQSVRVFVSYLVFVVDQSNRSTLGGVAAGVFLASSLAWIGIRAAGVRSVLTGSTFVLVASRVALQYLDAPQARLWLGAMVIVCWGWLAFSLLVTRRELVALGMGLGFALDLGIRVIFRTVDTPWMPGLAAHSFTWALAVALLAGLARFDSPVVASGSTLRASASLFAVGPVFVLYLLMTGNLGLAQSHLGLNFPGASVVLTFGLALGILGAALRYSGEIAVLANMRWWLAWRVTLVVISAGGFWWFWTGPPVGSIGLILGTSATTILFAELLLDDTGKRSKSGLASATLFFALGLLVEVGLLFGYYSKSGSPTFLAAAVGVFLLIPVLQTPKAVRTAPPRGLPIVVVAGVIGGLLLLVSGWEVWSWNDASASAAIGPTITVMTYNIQNGFSAGERFDLEKTAEVIGAQHPDIVVLEEVSRGWLVTSGVDEVLWLSQRLKMNYVFGANSDDGMWGNVVLSTAPIGSVQKVQYDVTENLKRSVLEVEIATQSGPLWVLATHLDNPADAGEIRLRQANELIAAWNHQSPALLMGDMNSDPTDPVISVFQSAGLVDYGRSLPESAYTSKDGRRIDYIFGTRDVALNSIEVPNVWTSDHRPVVARVRILPVQATVPSSIIPVNEEIVSPAE